MLIVIVFHHKRLFCLLSFFVFLKMQKKSLSYTQISRTLYNIIIVIIILVICVFCKNKKRQKRRRRFRRFVLNCTAKKFDRFFDFISLLTNDSSLLILEFQPARFRLKATFSPDLFGTFRKTPYICTVNYKSANDKRTMY